MSAFTKGLHARLQEFSIVNCQFVGAINNQSDYKKNRNYWKYLKTKLRKEENELVSATNQLKLRAADGKRYDTDVLDAEGISPQPSYIFPLGVNLYSFIIKKAHPEG